MDCFLDCGLGWLVVWVLGLCDCLWRICVVCDGGGVVDVFCFCYS